MNNNLGGKIVYPWQQRQAKEKMDKRMFVIELVVLSGIILVLIELFIPAIKSVEYLVNK